MNVKKIVSLINEIESDFPVDQFIIDNIPVWPIMRIRIYNRLFKENYIDIIKKKNSIAELKFLILGFYKYINSLLKDKKQNLSYNETADALFLSDGISFVYQNEFYCERFCDPFIEILKNHNYKSALLTPHHHYYTPRLSKSRFIQPNIDIAKIKVRLFKKSNGILNPSLPSYLKELEKFFLKIEIDELVPELFLIKYDINLIKNFIQYFNFLIDKIRPKIAFVVSYYNEIGMAYNYSCNINNVPVIDIQHGAINKYHPAYARWEKIPEFGFKTLPKYFWCWSQNEAKIILDWNTGFEKFHKPIIGGNLYLQKWQSGNDETVKHFDDLLERFKKTKKINKSILYSFNNVSGGELSNALKLIKIINNNFRDRFFIFLRIHPGHKNQISKIKKFFMDNGVDNFDIENATHFPLYSLLRHVDLHITEYSSTAIEASDFGIKTIFVHKIGKTLFPFLIERGDAYLLDKIEDFYIKQHMELFEITKSKRNFNELLESNSAIEYLATLIKGRKN